MKTLFSSITESMVPLDKYGITINDLDGRFLYVNQAYVDLVGYSEQELLGMSYQDITHPDDVTRNEALDEEVSSNSMDFFKLYKRYIHRDGHILNIILHVGMIRGADGQPDRFIAFIFNIADLSEEEETPESNYLATLPEPLNNLLESVELVHHYKRKAREKSIYLEKLASLMSRPLEGLERELAALSQGGSAVSDTRLTQLRGELQTLSSQVQSMQLLEQLELNQFELRYAEANLADLLKMVCGHMQALAVESGLQLELEQPSDEPVIFQFDATRLQLVVQELIRAAVARSSKGRISLKMEADAERFLQIITITDPGEPLSARELEAVFKDPNPAMEAGALGLLACRKLIEAHAGKLQFSHSEETGNCSVIKIPLRY